MDLYKTSNDKGISGESIYLKEGINLSLESKKTLVSGITYRKYAGFIEVFFSISAADITVPNGWGGIILATLPEGYRPTETISKIVYCRQKNSITTLIPINLYIKTDGKIHFINLTGADINFEHLIDHIIFPIV